MYHKPMGRCDAQLTMTQIGREMSVGDFQEKMFVDIVREKNVREIPGETFGSPVQDYNLQVSTCSGYDLVNTQTDTQTDSHTQ